MSHDVAYIYRALDRWPGTPTNSRRDASFRVSSARLWADLSREILHLGASEAILLADCDASEIRIDGRFRANARFRGPGVVLALESSRHGPLKYPCDTYTEWSDNLRAISLALTALRAVDRYGVTRRGEQYTGWRQLPSSIEMPAAEFATVQDAARFIAGLSACTAANILMSQSARVLAFRQAAKRCHPDTGGSAAEMAKLNRAREVLDRGSRA